MKHLFLVPALVAVALSGTVNAAAIRDASSFTTNSLARNDDGSTAAVNIGFNVNINGTSYSQLFVNNNGNVTFAAPLSSYTPTGILTSATPIIAPFWADVDTRSPSPGLTQYGATTLGGANVFGVNWINVGYFNQQANKLNSFQLILTDLGSGDFSIEFNYDQVQWETGGASGGNNGLGGSSARVGYTIGTGAAVELAGSAVNGAFLDGGPAGTSLIANSSGSNVLGRYIFQGRGGVIVSPPTNNVPVPGTLVLLGLGLLGFALKRKAV